MAFWDGILIMTEKKNGLARSLSLFFLPHPVLNGAIADVMHRIYHCNWWE
jgi:hypothetical protein